LISRLKVLAKTPLHYAYGVYEIDFGFEDTTLVRI